MAERLPEQPLVVEPTDPPGVYGETWNTALLELFEKQERKDLFRQILEISREQFYALGTVMVPEGYGIVRNDFHNVPKTIPESADYNDPAPTNTAQYFIE